MAKFKIDVNMVQEALRRLRTRPRKVIPQEMSLTVADTVGGNLVSRRGQKCNVADFFGMFFRRVSLVALPATVNRPSDHVVQNLVDSAPMSTCRMAAIVDRGGLGGSVLHYW